MSQGYVKHLPFIRLAGAATTAAPAPWRTLMQNPIRPAPAPVLKKPGNTPDSQAATALGLLLEHVAFLIAQTHLLAAQKPKALNLQSRQPRRTGKSKNRFV